MIIFIIDEMISCLVRKYQKLVKDVNQSFPKAKSAISIVLFCLNQQFITQMYLVYTQKTKETRTH